MQHGFIKVAAASPKLLLGNCEYNVQQIAKAASLAAKQNVHLLVLPQLSICGSTCGDLFFQQSLLNAALAALKNLCANTATLDMLIAAGLPINHRGKIYNCAAIIYKGHVLGLVPKSCPTNSELRYFAPAFAGVERCETGPLRGVPIGVQLLFSCAAMPTFTFAAEIGEDSLLAAPPSILHTAAGANIVVNLSAYSALAAGSKNMHAIIAAHSARLMCGYVCAQAGEGESTTDFVFAADSCICENGKLLANAAPFSSGTISSEIDVQRAEHERQHSNLFQGAGRENYLTIFFEMELSQTQLTRRISAAPFVPEDATVRNIRCEEILSIQAAGLQKRIQHTCAKKLVIGVSGGLDSTLALLVALRALKKLGRNIEDIVAISMPGFGTGTRTRGNTEELCGTLGIPLKTIDITQTVRAHFEDITHDENEHDVVYENAQARMRTLVLMDIANQQNGLVVGTGDLSELALGWATYNGDHMSMYAVNSCVPKTLIRYLLAYEGTLNPSINAVLQDIINTPVSPELLPGKNGEIAQQTEELVGPYELHDFYLYYMLRWGFTPQKIYRLAVYAMQGKYTCDEIKKWLKAFYKRFFTQQYKRSCLPDGPRVGSVCLSPRGGLCMPSDAVADEWLENL